MIILCKFDNDGNRISSVDVTFSTDQEIAEYKNNGYIEVNLEDYNKLIGNVDGKEYIYKDGQIIEKPAYVPTEEEKVLAKINEIMAANDEQIADIKDAMLVAVFTDDTELQEELKQEYASVIEDTNNKLQEVKESK